MKVLNVDISSFDLIRYKNEGLVPCYYDGKINKFDVPSNRGEQLFEVYLLTSEQYDRMIGIEKTLNERIELELKKVGLLKELVPSILNEVFYL